MPFQWMRIAMSRGDRLVPRELSRLRHLAGGEGTEEAGDRSRGRELRQQQSGSDGWGWAPVNEGV